MKLTDQIITANHNLFRNKTRTFLTILAVFIGSFTIILSNAVNVGVNDFIDKQVESIGGDDFVMVFPAAMSDQITAITTSGSKITEYNPTTGSALTASITDELKEKLENLQEQIKDQNRIEEQEKPRKWWGLGHQLQDR